VSRGAARQRPAGEADSGGVYADVRRLRPTDSPRWLELQIVDAYPDPNAARAWLL